MQTHISDYRVFFDQQAKGFRASAGSCVGTPPRISMAFMFSSDGKRGVPQHRAWTEDFGKTWSDPVLFGPPLSDPDLQFQSVSLAHVTSRGTTLGCGMFIPVGIREDSPHYEEDIAWRPSEALIARQEKGQADFQWTRYPTGTFMGEQFIYPGLITRKGRIILAIWGAAHKGENWQCGVLLSDDDGLTWRYRCVGYVADKSIRAKPAVPAGFNEETLFELPDSTLVSIIRGRERLGATDDTLIETYFFRSESPDGGETWSQPQATNLAGTGAAFSGVVLPDGSLLHAARIPHNPAALGITCPAPNNVGLHLARSRDMGRTWKTEHLIQHEPDGRLFDNYYNVMNGQFLPLGPASWAYVFGLFDYKGDRHHILSVRIDADRPS